MYETLKTILPHNFLKRNEPLFRKIVYRFYKGATRQCPICEKKLRKFILLKNGETLCPFCGSLPRHRRLWTLISPFLQNGISVLDFSPPLSFYKKIKSFKEIQYKATDFEKEFTADLNLDITNINLSSNSIDLILCYHILEHIPEDKKAIGELYRILKSPGKCFIQTPFREGDIYEDPSKQSKEERRLHFGQDDHVRIYSLQSLKERLEDAGFKTEVLQFSENEENYFGFSTKETVLKATK